MDINTAQRFSVLEYPGVCHKYMRNELEPYVIGEIVSV